MAARIDGVKLEDVTDGYIQKVFEAQTKNWGGPLLNHLVYARLPAVFRAVRGMWTGVGSSGLIDEGLQALVNRRVAWWNKCDF